MLHEERKGRWFCSGSLLLGIFSLSLSRLTIPGIIRRVMLEALRCVSHSCIRGENEEHANTHTHTHKGNKKAQRLRFKCVCVCTIPTGKYEGIIKNGESFNNRPKMTKFPEREKMKRDFYFIFSWSKSPFLSSAEVCRKCNPLPHLFYTIKKVLTNKPPAFSPESLFDVFQNNVHIVLDESLKRISFCFPI